MKEPTVLIVEDSDDEALLISIFLKQHTGIRIVGRARDGGEAIEYLGGAGRFSDRVQYAIPDAILLDLKMPGLSGFDVLDWLRSRTERPRVVVFTASLDEADKTRAFELGADDFRTKPVGIDELEVFVKWLEAWIAEQSGFTAGLRVPRYH